MDAPSVLVDALNQLDTFPALLMRRGRPVLESGRHEELAVERKMGTRGVFQVAAFHDDYSHVALFWARPTACPPRSFSRISFPKDLLSTAVRRAIGRPHCLREKLSDDLELTAIYAFSGALVPVAEMDGGLREGLRTASANR